MNDRMIGQTVYSADGSELGRVKEVRGAYFKVDAPMQPDYWLRTDSLQGGANGRLVVVADPTRYDEPDMSNDAMIDATSRDTVTGRRVDEVDRDHTTAGDAMAARARAAATAGSTEDERTLRLLEERLRVEKETEQAGEVRIGKRVTEHTETVNVPVREERVVIERTRGSGQAVAGGPELREGESIEVPVMREEVHVEKVAVETEQVRLRKESVERNEQVSANLRREELEVDDPDHVATGDTRPDPRAGRDDRPPHRR